MSFSKKRRFYCAFICLLLMTLSVSSKANAGRWGKKKDLTKVDPLTEKIFKTDDLIKSYNNILGMDIEGNFIWIATSRGIVRWNTSTKKYQLIASGLKLPSNRITSVTVDFNGNKWFGTPRGIVMYDGSTWNSYTRHNGIPSSTEKIICSAVDYQGNVWFGTRYGGVLKYNGKRWKNISLRQGLPDNMVVNISFDQKGNAWLSTFSGGVRHNGLDNQIFNISTGFPSGHVNVIRHDVQKDITWFGTINGLIGLKDEIVIKHTTRNGLPDNNVRTIALDVISGDLWVGTLRGGAAYYDGRDWKTFDRKSGLVSNFVRKIIIDSFGTKWVGTSAGLCVYDDEQWKSLLVEE